jgi:tetrahydromethanopterin S-methyltransferase subunit D
MNLLKRHATGMFASESMAGHLLRGGIGVALVYWAVQHQGQTFLAMLAAVGALLAFRGCPACWTIGLFETAVLKWRRLRGRG